MKNIKTIIISVAFTFLTVALVSCILFHNFTMRALNITDAESFGKILAGQELLKSLQQAQNTDTSVNNSNDTDSSGASTTDKPSTDRPSVEGNVDKETPATSINNIIYEDDYIKVTYVKQENSIFGPTLKFLIENKTSETLDISFTDVYIDGYLTDVCGVYVSDLTSEKKSFESLYLYESEYEAFTSFPSMVEFAIKVQSSETWANLSESQVIYIDVIK